MMQAVRLLAVLGILALVTVLGLRWYQDRPAPPEPLPALTLAVLDGRPSFDPAVIEGPYLINVWGSWCPYCQMEHPALMALQAEGIAIYGIAFRDTAPAANASLDRLGDPFVGVMLDVDGRSAQALDIGGTPETLVVGVDGRILARWSGPLTAHVLRSRIYPALERGARRD
ncbi:redoxin family protein [uncultured Maricaulis sp.]|uniref:redoxin family protein n=1 Tax=uncultured Maricaulis sp. TaxID=174710 RepID=UPI0030DD3212|tara:strand:+ start:29758 stop:30270 length:513 start_codon:yes stop_codon:yes gene_type:complete